MFFEGKIEPLSCRKADFTVPRSHPFDVIQIAADVCPELIFAKGCLPNIQFFKNIRADRTLVRIPPHTILGQVFKKCSARFAEQNDRLVQSIKHLMVDTNVRF